MSRGAIDEEKTRAGAKSVVLDYLRLEKDEHFLIVYDETTDDLAKYVYESAKATGATVDWVRYDQASQWAIAQGGTLPPDLLAKAHGAQCILNCLSSNPKCSRFRILLVRQSMRVGTRIAHMPGLDVSHLATAFLADFADMARWNSIIFRVLYFAKECTIITHSKHRPEPLELRLDLGGPTRLPAQSTGIPKDGSWCNIPGSEVYIAPIEGSAHGEIAVNGSMLGNILEDDVIIAFSKGTMSDWRSFSESFRPKLRSFEENASDDPDWKNLCEFGIGLNDRFNRLTGVQLLDEKAKGTVHIALGDNMEFGGRNHSKIHEDFVTRRPEFLIDDKKIMAAGEFVIDESNCFESLKNQNSDLGIFHGKRFRLSNSPTVVEESRLCIQVADARFQDFSLQVGDTEAATKLSIFVDHLKSVSGPMAEFDFTDVDRTLEKVPQMMDLLMKYGLISEVY